MDIDAPSPGASRSDDPLALALAPLAGPSPAGRDVRYEGDFDRILEARREDRGVQRAGALDGDVKRADWKKVAALCLATLGERSKDLRVACWLAEAWVRLDGFAGLVPGLRLIDGLCERFWDELHPRLEAGDASARVAALDSLGHRLPVAMRLWPVVVDPGSPSVGYTWADLANAETLEVIRQRDKSAAQKAEAGGAVTLARFRAMRARTPTSRLEAMAGDLAEAMRRLDTLDLRLAERSLAQAYDLGGIRHLAETIAAFCVAELALRPAESRRSLAAGDKAASAASRSGPETRSPSAWPMTHALADRQLREIADFLQAVEPQSPATHALRRLADRGDLNLAELTRAFSEAGGDPTLLLRFLGLIRPASAPEKN